MRKVLLILLLASCSRAHPSAPTPPPVDTTTTSPKPFDISSIEDTYADVASFNDYPQWGPYNVHDPSIKKFGNTYYCYSTDVAYGLTVRPGIQVRTSPDLVQWTFKGWVFDALPPAGAAFITSNGGVPNQALWAPYILQVGSEYRLYYSLASATARLSVIGLAVAPSPSGPWQERGVVVGSTAGSTITNAIDPTVVMAPDGSAWMYYGSAFDGIYALQLNPATGLALTPGATGKRIANRGFTNGQYNGNIEGSEVIYDATRSRYYLFIAYDWLTTKYNVRAAWGVNPQGPFYDYAGQDINTNVDHTPMIIAPYRFNGHGGWQGTAHCTVFSDGNGQYFIAHQGRPGVDYNYMDLHVRKLFFTPGGWPVASPERYAWEPNDTVPVASLAGTWEQIDLGYQVVPGYASEQVSPDFQSSVPLTLSADGTFNGSVADTWTYAGPWLTLRWSGGRTDTLLVQSGRDWENKRSTIIFTGLNNTGTAVWGKKD